MGSLQYLSTAHLARQHDGYSVTHPAELGGLYLSDLHVDSLQTD